MQIGCFVVCIWHTGHVCDGSWCLCRDSRVLRGVGSRLRTGSVHIGATAGDQTPAAQRQSPAGTAYTHDHDSHTTAQTLCSQTTTSTQMRLIHRLTVIHQHLLDFSITLTVH